MYFFFSLIFFSSLFHFAWFIFPVGEERRAPLENLLFFFSRKKTLLQQIVGKKTLCYNFSLFRIRYFIILVWILPFFYLTSKQMLFSYQLTNSSPHILIQWILIFLTEAICAECREFKASFCLATQTWKDSFPRKSNRPIILVGNIEIHCILVNRQS